MYNVCRSSNTRAVLVACSVHQSCVLLFFFALLPLPSLPLLLLPSLSSSFPPLPPSSPHTSILIKGTRFSDGDGSSNEVQRTMLELINQLDGFDPRGNIKVLMATNRSGGVSSLMSLFHVGVDSILCIIVWCLCSMLEWSLFHVGAVSIPCLWCLYSMYVYIIVWCLYSMCRPDTLDPALLRPGRMDRKVEFGLPDLEVN